MQHNSRSRRPPLLVLSMLLALPIMAAEISVSSVAELTKAAAEAKPGDAITLADGQYDEPCTLEAKGTAEQPVVIRSETIGGANLRGRLRIARDHVTLSGFRFTGKGWVFIKARGIRMTRCTMTNVQNGKWVQVDRASRNVEIDHCLFEKKENNRTRKSGCQLLQIVVTNKKERHHLHHNHFRDIPKGRGNGFETVQLITQGNPFDPPPGHSGTVVEDNLFERCSGEAEIISVKSNGNLFRRNTFRTCYGGLVFRHGDANVAIQNLFLGDGEKGSGGIRIQGTDQVIVNNYFHNLGRAGVSMMDGTPDKLYVRVERASILHNTFLNCRHGLEVGINHPKYPDGTVPRQCLVAGNIFAGGSQIVRYVKDDQPGEWQWSDNIFQGKLGIPPLDGMREQDPHLQSPEDGLPLPTARTPVAERPPAKPHMLTEDLNGSHRPSRRTLGALQFSQNLIAPRPLTPEQVGPHAKGLPTN